MSWPGHPRRPRPSWCAEIGGYVHHACGIWKVVQYDKEKDRFMLRWVRGSKPSYVGALLEAKPHHCIKLNDMEVVALACDPEVVL